MIKIGNKCISSANCLIIFAIVLFSSIGIASSITGSEKTITEDPQYWIPTKEDIAYQDSMYRIIQQTQLEVDTIKQSIDHIIDRLDADQQ